MNLNANSSGSSNTLIDGSKLRNIPIKSPIKKLSDNHLSVFTEVKKKNIYAIVADVSRGMGFDASAFIVFNITKIPYDIVAVYKNPDIASLLFPNVIVNIAQHYNNAYVLIETNDNGQQVADIIRSDLDYEHILYTQMSNGTWGQCISAGFSANARLGVKTSLSTKRIGAGNLKSLIEMDKLIVNSYDIIYELSRYVSDGKSYAAQEGHDDLCTCLVLFGWMMVQTYMKDVNDLDVRHQMVLDQEDDMITPFLLDGGIEVDPADGYMIDQQKLKERMDMLMDSGWTVPGKDDWDW